MATYRKCNMCGKELDSYENFHIHYEAGYESKYDLDKLNLDLCNACLDEVIDWLRSKCVIDPIEKEKLIDPDLGGYQYAEDDEN